MSGFKTPSIRAKLRRRPFDRATKQCSRIAAPGAQPLYPAGAKPQQIEDWTMPKAMITGVNGFTGRYLAGTLQQAGYTVVGLAGEAPGAPIPDVDVLHVCALADRERLTELVGSEQPDVVAHLAAIAFVAHGDADAIYQTNLLGTRNLLEALRHAAAPQAVLLASSANVYGNATAGVLDEACPPAPANDYAVSKLAMEYVARLYSGSLPIILARPFNYTGVGQSEQFLLPKIVKHVQRREAVIELGNLDVARDFSDVRTVVQCYRRLLETPAARGGVFNICSGKAHTLDEVLEMVRQNAGYDFAVRVNPQFVRANEIKTLCGSRARLESVIGAVTDIPLTETLGWMIATHG